MAATPPEQIRSLVNQLYAAWSLHQPEKTDAIFTDDGIYEDVAAGRMHRGKEQIKDFLRAAFAWSPDFRVTMKSLIIAHDAAATEWLRRHPDRPHRRASRQRQQFSIARCFDPVF
jgi:uncharacterized protein (TIGR02246 family)